jgi:uncharacterized protein YkwD
LRQYSVNHLLALEKEEKSAQPEDPALKKIPWLPKLVCVVATLIMPLFFSGPILHAQEPTGDSQADLAAQNEAFELEVIRLVNIERTSHGLQPLAFNNSLTEAARAHNQDMILNGFFAHIGSDGSTPAQRACAHGYAPFGWGECFVGENIAAGYCTPAEVMGGWMKSSGHRANILNSDYREVGVGHNTGGEYGDYWTMDLGAQPNQPLPRLSTAQDTLVFLSELGSGHTVPASLPLDIQNSGGDILHWTASDDRAWLILSGSSGDAPARLSVWVDNSTGVLNSLGTKTATVNVSATNPDALDTPQNITVLVHVVNKLNTTHLPLILR